MLPERRGGGWARPALLAVAIAALAATGAGCSNAPTTVLLHVSAQPGLPAPDALLLTIFDDGGRVLDGYRVPQQGSPQLPGDLVLYPAQETGLLRSLVQARIGGVVVGEGATSVELRAAQQVEATVLITIGRLADRDGDGVPDVIDNCPDLPNPAQDPCSGPDGGHDAGRDAAHDGGRDAAHEGPLPDVRGDLPPDLPNDCKIDDDCDDGNSCTLDRCVGGACVRTPTNEASSCDDGNACTDGTTCSAGVCGGGEGLTCAVNGSCRTASCEPAQGCVVSDRANGTSCDDGLFCTINTTCSGGVCGGGAPHDCGSPPACKQLTCDNASSACLTSLLAAGTSCDDGDACTQDERCSVGGACQAPAPIDEQIVAVDAVGRTDRSTLVDAAGNVHTVYRLAGTGFLYATNTSGSWTSAKVDGANNDINGGLIVNDALGRLTIFYVHEGSKELRLVTQGITGAWSSPEKVTDANYGTAGLIDASGTFHLAYTNTRALHYLSGKPGAWGAPVMVDPAPASGFPSSTVSGHSPSMARDSKGNIHIAHGVADVASATFYAYELRHSSNETMSWVTVAPAKATVTMSHGGSASLGITKNDKLYVSHYSQASGHLYLTQRTGASWSTQSLDTGGAGSFSSLVLDSKDSVHIAYRQYSGSTALKYITNANGPFATQVLDSGSNTGRQTALARAASGRLHIVFSRQASAQLRHYSFSACP